MAKEPKRINFDDFTINPGKVFDDMARQDGPVLIDVKGRLYRLELESTTDGIWKGYDPEKVRLRLREAAGAMAGIDRETLLRDIHHARQQVSHGRSD
jgi:hypothetical protein